MSKLNLGSIRFGDDENAITVPRDIFSSLPKKEAKFDYLRDVQGKVLDKWVERRTEKDNIIKMNTGGGKTLVALLMLKCSLNEGVGPALYLAPDKYLATQAMEEANALGIEVTDDPESMDFLGSEAILVTTFHKLFNGKSKFGVGGEVKIPIGSIVIDDAHSCMERLEEQFTIQIDSGENSDLYGEILEIFKVNLEKTFPAKYKEIAEGDSRALLSIPFWEWEPEVPKVLEKLHKYDDEFPFQLPLIGNILNICNCVVSGSRIEISPILPPVEQFRSYISADRRIFMTATLAREGSLVSHFRIDEKAAQKPITPDKNTDIGDRMILVPQSINSEIEDASIVNFAKRYSAEYNVVVIAASSYAAKKWQSVADKTVYADSLYKEVESLKKGHVGLVVLVNKYDGVDLPDDACRLLIVDDIPAARSMIDKIRDSQLDKSDDLLSRRIQRIEQGMGRGVRSNNDYCGIILMGKNLIRAISSSRGIQKFSSATRAQIELASLINKQLKGGRIEDLEEPLDMLFERDSEWVKKSRSVVVKYANIDPVIDDPVSKFRRAAFDSGYMECYSEAERNITSGLNQVSDQPLKGLLLQEAAQYAFIEDRAKGLQLQQRALKENRYLNRVSGSIQSSKRSAKALKQSQLAVRKWKTYENAVEAVSVVKAACGALKFKGDDANSEEFEAAVKVVGEMIGLSSTRPEKEMDPGGPDNLWQIGDDSFVVIECKGGAQTEHISKSDLSQIGTAVDWFERNYASELKVRGLLIHPSRYYDRYGSPRAKLRIMETKRLAEFVCSVESFATSVGANWDEVDIDWMQDTLSLNQLLSGVIIERFSCEPKPPEAMK